MFTIWPLNHTLCTDQPAEIKQRDNESLWRSLVLENTGDLYQWLSHQLDLFWPLCGNKASKVIQWWEAGWDICPPCSNMKPVCPKPCWLKAQHRYWSKLAVFNLPFLTRLFHSPPSPTLPPTLGSTPVKTWKVINKCPLCCRTNTDGIWLTHGGLAEPWAGPGKQATTLQRAAGLCGCQNIS